MELYDYYRSTASYRVRIALNLKELDLQVNPIHLLNDGGEHHKPEYRRINPQGLVPSLVVNHEIITQSLSIIEYLDEMYPSPPLLPKDPIERAHVRSIALLIACDIHPLNNLRVLNKLKSQFNAKASEITQWYHHWLREGFDAIERKLEALNRQVDVCSGKNITLADICLIPQVYNAKRFEFPLNNYPIIQKINDYCLTLPSFIQAGPEPCHQPIKVPPING